MVPIVELAPAKSRNDGNVKEVKQAREPFYDRLR